MGLSQRVAESGATSRTRLIRNVRRACGLVEHLLQRAVDVRRRVCGEVKARRGAGLKVIGDVVGFRRNERVDVDVFAAGKSRRILDRLVRNIEDSNRYAAAGERGAQRSVENLRIAAGKGGISL